MKTLLSTASLALLAALMFSSCEKKIEVAEYGSISGTVYADSSNQPLANVRISTSPASGVVLTDSNGSFTIPTVPTGETTVKAEKTGYNTQSVSVKVVKNQTVDVFFLLTHPDPKSPTYEEITDPEPHHQAQQVPVDTSLSWSFSGEDTTVTFDVFLYSSHTSTQQSIVTDTTGTSVEVNGLRYETTYYWYVVARKDGEKIASSEVWSFTTADLPDNHLVFAREVDGSYEVFSSSLTGEYQFPLTTSPALDWNPSLNSLVSRIAFTSNRGFDYQIYHMNRTGSDLNQVTTLAVTGYHNQGLGYCWSPNSNGFLYSHYDKLYYINKDGSGLTSIIDTAPGTKNWREVDWHGSTQKIVAQAVGSQIYNSEIYIMDQDGSNAQLLVADSAGRTDHPVFSIDGTQILYTHDAQGLNSADGRQLDSHIYLLDLATMNVTDLSVNKPAGSNDLMPEFSPNGSKVIFVNMDNTGTGPAEIWEMDLTGANRTLIVEDATMPHAL